MENAVVGLIYLFIIIVLISWIGKKFFDLSPSWSIFGFLALLGGCSE